MERPDTCARETRSASGSEATAAGAVTLDPSARSERTLFLVGLLAAAALLAAMAWPMAQGRLYTADDLGSFHIPVREFYSRALANGWNFTWLPGLYCGVYVHGEGQAGMLHPLHLALYRFLPFALAFNLELFLSYPVMLAGAYVLLRRRGLRKDSSIFGAMLFAFSGFNLLHFVHMNAIAIFAHVPWLIVAVDVSLRSERARRAAWANLAAACLVGSMLLLGHPQAVWLSMIVVATFAVLVAPQRRRGRAALLAASLFAGALIGGAQLVPTCDALMSSERSGSASWSQYAAGRLSLPPANLVQLVAPYLFKNRIVADEAMARVHEYGLYDGAVAIALVAWLVVSLKGLAGQRRALAMAGLLLVVAGFSLALGKYGVLQPIVSRLPLVGSFRAPCRYISIAHAGMALCAAVAFDAMRAAASRRGRLGAGGWAIAAVPVAAAASALFFSREAFRPTLEYDVYGAQHAFDARLIVLGPALVAVAATLALVAARRGRTIVFAALVAFAAADIGAYGVTFMRSRPVQSLEAMRQSLRLPEAEPSMRVENMQPLLGDAAMLAGWRVTTGAIGLVPAKALDYTMETPLRLASTRWRWIIPRTPEGGFQERTYVEEIPDPMPRARLVTKVVPSAEPGRELGSIDIKTTAFVSERIDVRDGPAGAARITRDLPGDIVVETDAPTQQLLVISESYSRDWRATVDGRPARRLPVYGDFLGVVVGPGRHEVRVLFQARSLRLGLAVTGAGLVLATLLFALAMRGGTAATEHPQAH